MPAGLGSQPPGQPTPRARAHVSSAPPSQPTPRARAHVRCGPALTAPTHAPSRTRTRQLRPALAAPKSPVVPPHAPTLARALAGSSHIQPCTYPTQPWLFLAPAPQYTQDLGRTAPPLSYAARPSSTRVRKLQPHTTLTYPDQLANTQPQHVALLSPRRQRAALPGEGAGWGGRRGGSRGRSTRWVARGLAIERQPVHVVYVVVLEFKRGRLLSRSASAPRRMRAKLPGSSTPRRANVMGRTAFAPPVQTPAWTRNRRTKVSAATRRERVFYFLCT